MIFISLNQGEISPLLNPIWITFLLIWDAADCMKENVSQRTGLDEHLDGLWTFAHFVHLDCLNESLDNLKVIQKHAFVRTVTIWIPRCIFDGIALAIP